MKNKKTVLLLSILLIQFISFGQLEANQKNFKSAVSTMMFGHKFNDPITREFLEEAEQNGIVKYNLEGSFEQKKYAWKKFILENEALCTKKDKSDGLSEWSILASSSGPYGLRFSSSSCDDPNKYILQKLQEEIKKSNVLISFIDNDRLNQFQEDFTNKLSNVSITNSAFDILFFCERMSTEKEGLKFLELLEQKGIIKYNRNGQIDEKILALKQIHSYLYPLKIAVKDEGKLTVLQSSTSKFGLGYKGEMMISSYNYFTENDLWFKDQKNRLKVSEINDKELQKFIKEYSKNGSLYAQSSNDNSQEQNCEQAKKKYLEQNPDVAKFGMDAWNHYNSYGKKEGRKWPACSDESNSALSITQDKNDNKIADIITHLNSSSENFKKKDYIATINDCNKILELYDNNANSLYPKEITKEADYYNTYFENTVYHNSYELYCWILQLRGTCRFYLNDLGCARVDLEKSIQWNTSIKNYLFKSSDWRISSCFLWNSDCNLLIGLSYLKNTQYKESILYFNKAIEINGLNLKAYNYRGIANCFLYDQTGANFKAAMSDFNFVINKKSNSLVTAYLARGYLNKLLENSVGSCEDVNLAMQISKSKEWLITEFDNTLLDFPQFNKAINNCKNSVQSNKVATPEIIKDPVQSDKIVNSDIIKEPVPIALNKEDFENKIMGISDVNSKLSYIRIVIENTTDIDLKLHAIAAFTTAVVYNLNVNTDHIIYARNQSENVIKFLMENGIDNSEKEVFKIQSYVYILCQTKIDKNLNSFNHEIINLVLSNYTADTYIDKKFYQDLKDSMDEYENKAKANTQTSNTPASSLPDGDIIWKHSKGSFEFKFKEGDKRIWYEDGGRFIYVEEEFYNDGTMEGSGQVLKRKNENVYIKLTFDKCYFKDNSNPNWRLICDGGFYSKTLARYLVVDDFNKSSQSTSISTSTSNVSANKTVSNYKFTPPPALKITYTDNRKMCCCCSEKYAQYELQDKKKLEVTEKINYCTEKLALFHKENGNGPRSSTINPEQIELDLKKLQDELLKLYPNDGLEIGFRSTMWYNVAAMGFMKLCSTERNVDLYRNIGNHCSLKCKNICGSCR